MSDDSRSNMPPVAGAPETTQPPISPVRTPSPGSSSTSPGTGRENFVTSPVRCPEDRETRRAKFRSVVIEGSNAAGGESLAEKARRRLPSFSPARFFKVAGDSGDGVLSKARAQYNTCRGEDLVAPSGRRLGSAGVLSVELDLLQREVRMGQAKEESRNPDFVPRVNAGQEDRMFRLLSRQGMEQLQHNDQHDELISAIQRVEGAFYFAVIMDLLPSDEDLRMTEVNLNCVYDESFFPQSFGEIEDYVNSRFFIDQSEPKFQTIVRLAHTLDCLGQEMESNFDRIIEPNADTTNFVRCLANLREQINDFSPLNFGSSSEEERGVSESLRSLSR